MKGRNPLLRLLRLSSFFLVAIALHYALLSWSINPQVLAQSELMENVQVIKGLESDLYQLYQSATVRVVKIDSAGSGVIINRSGNIYAVLTNWHVVDQHTPLILTVDDQQHQLTGAPQQLGNSDLALLQFNSEADYPIAQLETTMPQVGETVYAAGFPLEINESLTLDLGNKAFRLTQGKILVVPIKSLPQGYQLGYTNDTAIGMSGSPIFNTEGSLVAIHGRGKYRDPGFGVYIFEDGSEPPPEQLEQMIQSSWGIPINTYVKLINQERE